MELERAMENLHIILKKPKNFTYIDLDIPETLTLASYFLSKCFPEKRNFFLW